MSGAWQAPFVRRQDSMTAVPRNHVSTRFHVEFDDQPQLDWLTSVLSLSPALIVPGHLRFPYSFNQAGHTRLASLNLPAMVSNLAGPDP